MSKIQSDQRAVPMSLYEKLVLDALSGLPSTYRVTMERRGINSNEEESGVRFRYEPDFEVTSSSGQRLLIDVKSEHSMSLPNMVRFSVIDKIIRQEPNNRLLILVWGTSRPTSRFSSRPEFEQLHIRYATNELEVRRAVEKEFSSSFQ
ncbi:hypothetical protein [Burkholderia ubonensis]|uniref:hypothetical protein n=1 Tax=Burkholderia ubonensis TaxID=101571 RepID=UPI001160674F|nr:hypothetical protein [Burkholderia ubonensis]